jgi:hypothetical protein
VIEIDATTVKTALNQIFQLLGAAADSMTLRPGIGSKHA